MPTFRPIIRSSIPFLQKLKGLVRYPTVMLVILAAVLAVMLVQVLPVFSDVYTSMTGSVEGSSYHYIRLAYGLCWAALCVMLALALFRWCARSCGGRPGAGAERSTYWRSSPLQRA